MKTSDFVLRGMRTGALIARVKMLEAALEPFAKAAHAFPDSKEVVLEARSAEKPNYYLTGADFDAARDALVSATNISKEPT